jgi:4-hydroxybenzoate polyprenyltransferase
VRTLGALLLSSHPVPALGVTLVAVLLGVAVGLEPWRLAVLGLAMALDQFSVGLSNDWIDADRDRAAGRTDKPVARGLVPLAVVRATAIGSAILAIAVTLPLGWQATVAHTIALLSAWTYNAGLKATPLSVLPYIVSFGALPAIATLARPEPALPAWWAMGAGALLGVAAHVANVVPDLDDDRRTGVRGLPHRLGSRGSTIVAGAALLGAAVMLAAGVGFGTTLGIVGLATSAVLTTAILVLVVVRPALRLAFRLVIVAALLDVAFLVVAGGHLVA